MTIRQFSGFFSYAHHDAKTDPNVVEAFTTTLEDRVNAKLTNARFAIWRDIKGLRTGDRWDEKIESAVRDAHILIVLLTPRWIESEYCRKEFTVFSEIEAARTTANYVVPILVRSVETQKKHFVEAQKTVYNLLTQRQYQQAIATDFLTLTEAQKIQLIDGVADDLLGMIDRLRLPEPENQSPTSPRYRNRPAKEFSSQAHNFERVDFVKNAEVILGAGNATGRRPILAQIEFLGRLYVKGDLGRIDFSISRAYLALNDDGRGLLSQISPKDDFESEDNYYLSLLDRPNELCICMDGLSETRSLAELALHPAREENYLAKIATVPSAATVEQLSAELIVFFDTESLQLNSEHQATLDPHVETKIKAIMEVVAKKRSTTSQNQTLSDGGQLTRPIKVTER